MRRLIATFAVVLLAASACTSDDPNAQDRTPAAAAPAATATVVPSEATATVVPPGETATGASPVATPTPHMDCASVGRPSTRTDIASTGNRWLAGTADLAVEPTIIELGREPAWVLPWSTPGSWYVGFEDGSGVIVSLDGEITPATAVEPDAVPRIRYDNDGAPAATAVDERADWFSDPLPDRRVTNNTHLVVSLVEPTDRYPHGVLGDRTEAGGVEIWDPCLGRRTRITIEPPGVIEGTTAMLADVDGDTAPEVIFTTSNGDEGARLEVWRTDGTFMAASAPIGRGNRWRNQLAVAPLGPNGEIEIIDVRTPHIGGTVQFFQLVDDRLERVANSAADYTSHVSGSINLDMGVLVDVTGDARPEVVLLNSQRTRLVALERTEDGVGRVAEIQLGAVATTNIALAGNLGPVDVAIGTRDGRLLVWTQR